MPFEAPLILLTWVLGGAVLLALAIAHVKSTRAARAESVQRESSRLRTILHLLDMLQLPAALMRSPQHDTHLSALLAEMFGVNRVNAPDEPWDWQHFVSAQDLPAWTASLAAASAGRRPDAFRVRMQVGEKKFEVLTQMELLESADDCVELVILLHPLDQQPEQRSILQLRDLLRMAEAEKWLFGQAVHDELGQRLSGIAFFAKTLQRKLESAGRSEASDAEWLTSLANESMSVARRLARGLVPVGTDDPDALAASLTELCQATSKMFSAACSLHAAPNFDAGGAARANHIYHAIQELMTNAIRHGAARHVDVYLEVDTRGQRVRVRNDGQALTAAVLPATRAGMGLEGVRSRVSHLGGQFTLVDGADGAVVATIELPPSPGVEGVSPASPL